MDLLVKDLFEVITWMVLAIGGTIAAFRAVSELRRANNERAEALAETREQFRWRQAEMARTILDQFWADSLARNARKILDQSGGTFSWDGQKIGPISLDTMRSALRTSETRIEPEDQLVRDAFDHLFEQFERLEHSLTIELVHWEDVRGPLEHYVGLLSKNKSHFLEFLTTNGFEGASRFLSRFSGWRMPGGEPASENSHGSVPDLAN